METVTAANFNSEVESSSTPVLVKFWADWCQPCRMLAPTLSKLAGEYAGRVKFVQVNAEDEASITGKFHVNALPTMLIFKGGKAVQSLVGLQSDKAIKAALDSHL